MDTEYLQCMVGEALALGLAEVAMKKPADPIDYLGCWLLRYKVNSKTASKVQLCYISREGSVTVFIIMQSKAADEMLSREIADARQQEEQRKRLAEEESRLLKNERSEEIVDIRIHRELDDVTRPGERKGIA